MPVPVLTPAQFQKASNLTMVISGSRGSDTVLQAIDRLLDEYQTARSAGPETSRHIGALARLYYAIDRWLLLADRKSAAVNARRRPAVHALYVNVVEHLCQETGVPVNLLPNWLTVTFGRSMNAHGVDIDLTNSSADYIASSQLQKYRIEFRAGVAYQQDFLRNRRTMVLVDSASIQGSPPNNPIRTGSSGYVVGANGDFYSAPHMIGTTGKKNGFFHSSYLGGSEVFCAGEITIKGGIVEAINNDSGHYRPTVRNVQLAVEMLAMYGVNMARLTVSGHGISKCSGEVFLATRIFDGGDLRRPAGPMNGTPLSRFQQAGVVRDHESTRARIAAFRQFKSCVTPANRPAKHSWLKRDKCEECRKHRWYEQDFLRAATGKGFDAVTIPAFQEMSAHAGRMHG